MFKFKLMLILMFLISVNLNADFLDYGTIILGRPTNNSITFNVLAKTNLEFYIEYGQNKGEYSYKTINYISIFPEPAEFVINNLASNQRYYYRIQYKDKTSQSFTASEEYYFQTQRPIGSSFTFNVESDPHLYDKKGSSGLMRVIMQNQVKDSADLFFDLGDTFGDDHNPTTITDLEMRDLQINVRQYFGMLCNRTPFFFALGNHEGESGYYLLQNPPNNLAVYGTKWRTKYYPNPYPDGFYSGNNEEEEYGIGKPQNYYSFVWGDALFVVLDVYRYYTANAKPTGWDWTIGEKQYQWFKKTLSENNSKYKFVFAHHVLGQGRGAVVDAVLAEWGGWKDSKKSKYEFDTKRPGWGKPIHQLMVDNKVNIFFQGHDHLYSKEELDGIIYQEVPIPCDSTYEIGYLANADAYTGVSLDGSGYLRIKVSSEDVNIDYVKSYLPKDETDSLKNGMVGYKYSIKPNSSNFIEDNPNEEFIKIFPNPTNEFIYLAGYQGNSEVYPMFRTEIKNI